MRHRGGWRRLASAPSDPLFCELITKKSKTVENTRPSIILIPTRFAKASEIIALEKTNLVKLLERVKRVLERLVHEKFSKRNWLKKFNDLCLAKKMRSESSRVVLHCGEVLNIHSI